MSAARTEGGEPHQAHQTPHALAIDPLPLGPQHRGHPARAEQRPGEEQLVEPAHDHEFARIGSRSRSVEVRARQPEQPALAPDRQAGVNAIEHGGAARSAHLPDLFAKKSRSTVS
jgi:hypothetical protein